MRISDWSSDVCSSDLAADGEVPTDQRTDTDHGRGRPPVDRQESGRCERRQHHSSRGAGELTQGVERLTGAEVHRDQIGSASCRERGCQYVSIAVVAVSLKKKHKQAKHTTKIHK